MSECAPLFASSLLFGSGSCGGGGDGGGCCLGWVVVEKKKETKQRLLFTSLINSIASHASSVSGYGEVLILCVELFPFSLSRSHISVHSIQ